MIEPVDHGAASDWQRKGLDQDGFIRREGSMEGVTAEFLPVVEDTRRRLREGFAAGARLHSAYLYGSVPRGTAQPARSDLDLVAVVHDGPTDGDRADAHRIGTDVDAAFPQIDGAAVVLLTAPQVLSELERHDAGFFLACLCTPLLGDDLAARLPRYRPDSSLARETNGDLDRLLPLWRERAATAFAGGRTGTEEQRLARARLARSVGRRLVRTAFTLVMPWWQGWTSDLDRSVEVFGQHLPGRVGQARLAARLARIAPGGDESPDVGEVRVLLEDFGPWLAEEYRAAHGVRTPRPTAAP